MDKDHKQHSCALSNWYVQACYLMFPGVCNIAYCGDHLSVLQHVKPKMFNVRNGRSIV
jgi:hypothetical protein